MKKNTIILLFIGLFSFAAFAQTKPKPKTAAKPIEAKPTTKKPKSANAEPTNAKSAVAKSKNSPTEKKSPEKPKSVKTQPAKDKTAKEQAAKTQNAKAKSAKTESVKIQPVKSPTKTAAQPIAKSIVKPKTKTSAKTVSQPKAKTEAKIKVQAIVKPTVKFAPLTTAKPTVELAAKPAFDAGELSGSTYTNKTLNFEITLPAEWNIADADFAENIKKQGFDLNIETPKAASASVQNKLEAATNRVKVLLTAYKASPETNENAILRVSIEDLRPVPQVRDAVDYFDSMRATYQNVKLPAGFKYSETQAEKLGAMQFGFLDVTNGAGKKRMYATVRGGYAVMFTLTYSSAEDLAALKNVLAAGDFRRR